jgi:7,8-dihydropterin-6-yl-methyl-4-(beta-D-ribofuranosyl)aminobenzene 5'-phosphate synthase
MKKWFILFLVIGFVLTGTGFLEAKTSNPITVTILYDNYPHTPGAKGDWGYGCLVKGTEKTILFDTGTKPGILLHNFKTLNIDPGLGELVILSHDHGDHTNGIWAVLEKNKNRKVFIPQSFVSKFTPGIERNKAKAVSVDQPVQVCKDVYLTGEMGGDIKEQSLIIDTEKGLILITGCSHPGIVDIVKKAMEVGKKKVYLVFGGFHLLRKSEDEIKDIIAQFKKLGVQKVGATHCTGDKAVEMFKKAYGKDFVGMGVGKVVSMD